MTAKAGIVILGIVFAAILGAVAGCGVEFTPANPDYYEKVVIDGVTCVVGPAGALACDFNA